MTGEPMSCNHVRELAPELAMDVLAGPERGDALLHLDGCASCRAFVGELAETADLLVLAAPEAEPPPGFAERVLAAAQPARRRPWRRVAAVVAAAAAVAAIVSITTVRIVQSNDTGRDTRSAAVEAGFRGVAMMGGDGHLAGSVFVSNADPAWLNVSVQYAVPDGTYRVMLGDGHGDAKRIGSMTITNGWGRWSGHVPAHRLEGARLALVDASGTRVCEAMLDGVVVDDAYGVRGDGGAVASGLGITAPTG